MPNYRIRLSTGPLSKENSRELARKFKRAHIRVVAQGTSHLIVEQKGVTCEGAHWNLGVMLNHKGLKSAQWTLPKLAKCTVAKRRKRHT